MPICPKCGKSFSSEQALTYHLNKKYKCGTWKCATCNSVFATKFALKIHQMSCKDEYTQSVPSYDVLCKVYSRCPFVIIETDEHDVVHSVSPSCSQLYGYQPGELVGKKNESFIEKINDDIYRKTSSGESVLVKRHRLSDNIFMESVA
jgi:hypothetical protein